MAEAIPVKNTLIYLIGFSGIGKLTIASAIARLIPVVIIDNQLINDPLFTAIEADGKTPIPFGVWEQAIQIRNAVLHTVRHYGKPDSNFIFTNELFERNTGDNALYKAVEELAAFRGNRFVPVHLLCEEQELLKRAVSEGRRQKRKLVDAQTIAEKLGIYTLLKPLHPQALTLDVTMLSADAAALCIVEHTNALAQGA